MSEDRFPLEELARLPSFHHPVASPTGDAYAYYYDGTGRNELYVDQRDGSGPRQLSDGNVPRSARWFIQWRDDGEAVLYHRDEDGNEQNDIWELTLDGDARRVVDIDGQGLLLGSVDDGRSIVYASDAGRQMNLYRYDRDADEQVQLTTFDQPVRGGIVSPDGTHVSFNANESDDLENQDIYVAEVTEGAQQRNLEIGEEGAEARVADWHPDGDRLLVSDNSPDKPRAGIYHLETDDVTWYGDDDLVEEPVAFTPDGDGFIVSRIKEAAHRPVYFELDGTTSQLDVPIGVASFPHMGHTQAFLDDDQVLVANTTTTERDTLYAYDLATDTSEVLIEPEYGDIDKERFVAGEYVTYESTDGLEIGGILYDSGDRPAPVVVSVHGGPPSQSVQRFDQYAQFFIDRGFSVFQPNYRGSIGRGREFKHMIHHDWGGGEAEDIAAAGRWLAAQDWVDEDRLIVYGGSYGGYSTYWQLVQYPGLWATGIAWVGITDLLQLYENSMPHFKATLEEYLGDPEENEEFYRERSPITHVENIEDPILMVHGVNDPRCPIEQARTFRDALESRRGWTAGEDFVYHELSEEGHGTTDVDQKVRAFRIIEEYLEEWV